MTDPKANICIPVDLTNPGQFFACCGLLELADRLWPGAEAWFEQSGEDFFCLRCEGTLRDLLKTLAESSLQSSLSDDGLKRLASLLSAAKDSLTESDLADKERLRAMWQRERLHLSTPFDLWLDWWWDEASGVKILKTWAAKQLVLEIARPMLTAITVLHQSEAFSSNVLSAKCKLSRLPFYFDAANNTQQTPRDYGVAPAEVKQAPSDRPIVELLTFLALQRFRPYRQRESDLVCYAVWSVPLPPTVAAAVMSNSIVLPHERCFGFRMLYRTDYMKAVLPAFPIHRS